jgi:hypothetical protein
MTEKKCLYCGKTYEKNSEHVFPHGLGGEKIFVDFVCEKCNSDFSNLEAELIQKSPLALVRSVEGVKGYKGNKAFFKAQKLLTYDEKNKIIYEISQHDEMKVSLKPQIIEINGGFFLEGSEKKRVKQFVKRFENWKMSSYTAITRLPDEKNTNYEYIKFNEKEGKIVYELFSSSQKIKSTILIQDFSPKDELYDALSPRLFFDDNKNLKVRAKTIDEGLRFLLDFVKYSKSPEILKSFSPVLKDNGVNYVGFYFMKDKLERAVVKITINILIHYFPEIKNNSALSNHLDYVNTGNSKIKVSVEERNDFKDSNDKTHNLFIHQIEDNLILRLSLFNGEMAFYHIIPKLSILKHNDYCRFINDYKNRKNRFENRNDMFMAYAKTRMKNQNLDNIK